MKTIIFTLIACVLVGKASCHSSLEVKTGYFFFTDSTMRKVYDQGGLDMQLSATYPITTYLHAYGSVEYFEKSGHSLNGRQKTSIYGIPLSFGIRPVFTLSSCVDYYFTLGPRYTFIQAHNRSSYVPKNMHGNGFGGFANMGFVFKPTQCITIDLFGEYSYTRLHFHSKKKRTTGHTVQVGGLCFGGGIGYLF